MSHLRKLLLLEETGGEERDEESGVCSAQVCSGKAAVSTYIEPEPARDYILCGACGSDRKLRSSPPPSMMGWVRSAGQVSSAQVWMSGSSDPAGRH